MSTTPALDPTQQPPPFPPVIQEQAYKSHTSHGSVGPVIGVLAVIMVLCAVAVMIGRLCSGRRVMGHLHYDFESWVESKCSSCIDGRMGPPPRRETVPVVVVESGRSNVSLDEAAAGTAPVTTESPEIVAEEATPSQVEEGSRDEEPQEDNGKHENGDGS